MDNTQIYVVTHKKYQVLSERIYKTVIVGNGDFELNGALKDSTGDNISDKNNSFCELTALYWIWKNQKHNKNDIVGINHYRRYFKSCNENVSIKESEIEGFIQDYDLIVPVKRNYFFISVEKHYTKAHNKKDLILLREIIYKKEPDYINAFDSVMKGHKISLYNMLITRWELFETYCEWIFPILFELEMKIDKSDYDAYQSRVVGFLAERLFNVWLERHKETLKILELPVYNTEGENLIAKSFNLIKRHYF